MINPTLVLMATLASPPPTTITRSTPEFEPDRAEVVDPAATERVTTILGYALWLAA